MELQCSREYAIEALSSGNARWKVAGLFATSARTPAGCLSAFIRRTFTGVHTIRSDRARFCFASRVPATSGDSDRLRVFRPDAIIDRFDQTTLTASRKAVSDLSPFIESGAKIYGLRVGGR